MIEVVVDDGDGDLVAVKNDVVLLVSENGSYTYYRESASHQCSLKPELMNINYPYSKPRMKESIQE